MLAPVPLHELVDLFVGRPSIEAPLDREREHRDRHRRRIGVDGAHAAVAELSRSGARTLERPRELRRDVHREDPLVRAELLVGREEVARGGLRRRRQLGCRPQALVERRRCQVDAVLEAVGTEVDVERDDTPVRKPLLRVREVGGRVEDDRRVPGVQSHALPFAALFTASTITSSSWSFVRHAAAPAS